MINFHAAYHLTVNEKGADRGLVMSKNGGPPCCIDGLRVLATDATSGGANSHKGTDGVQESSEWLRVCLEG